MTCHDVIALDVGIASAPAGKWLAHSAIQDLTKCSHNLAPTGALWGGPRIQNLSQLFVTGAIWWHLFSRVASPCGAISGAWMCSGSILETGLRLVTAGQRRKEG